MGFIACEFISVLVPHRPPLWSSDQSSWVLTGTGFDSRRYQMFCIAVGLERGPLSLVRINEKLFEKKSSGSGLEK
jgi:hypothetical protein